MQWKALEAHLTKAQIAGGRSFRAVGDVIGLRSQCSAADLIEYEAGLDARIVAKFRLAVLCLYDARKFAGVELLNALKAHRDTFLYPLGRLLA
jgi:hypothetical protein